MTNQGIKRQRIGKAGEHAVAAQLLLRDQGVFFPVCDNGVDLMTDSGCRIQVKTAHMSVSPKMIEAHGYNAYIFPLKQHYRIALSDSTVKKSKVRQPSEYCDVVVLWGVEQNRFWVVPSHLCDNRYCFRLGGENPKRYVGSESHLLEMKALGYSNAEIANQYGISRSRVSVMLNHPETIAESPAFVVAVRACENAWENIIDFDPAKRGQQLTEPEPAQKEI